MCVTLKKRAGGVLTANFLHQTLTWRSPGNQKYSHVNYSVKKVNNKPPDCQ